MKNSIIIAAIAAASALLLSVSCQKEQPESQIGINGGAKTFTAIIEQGLAKTTLTSEYKVNWTTGDKININGVTFKATADGTDATRATFAKEPDTQDDPVGTTFKAICPSTLYATTEEGTAHFKLPATQTYTAGEFNAPMYAESTTQTLSFKNICAVLAIKVTSADITALKSIKVKSDKAMYGTFTVSNDKALLSDATDATKAVELVSSSVLTLDETGTTFYIAIPAQEYSYLKIYLSEDGSLYKRAMITKKADGLGTIACNKIYKIDYATNAVQIYAGGPYWSTMNIGASSETGFGLYFAWGEKTGRKLTDAAAGSTFDGTEITNAFANTYNFNWTNCPYQTENAIDYNSTKYLGSTTSTHKDGTATDENAMKTVLDSDNDAATANWGAAWRMPTGGYYGEFEELEENTTSSWGTKDGVNGRTFTGNSSEYSDIRLFFPAAGYGYGPDLIISGDWGRYWSSSLYSDDTDYAYHLSFNSVAVHAQKNYFYRYYGLPVRPLSD